MNFCSFIGKRKRNKTKKRAHNLIQEEEIGLKLLMDQVRPSWDWAMCKPHESCALPHTLIY